MKARILILFSLLAITGFSACEKNSVSKIPNILLKGATQEILVNVDTMAIRFSIIDGDADLGNDTTSGVYWKDSRYDTLGFIRADFPLIDEEVEDPKKGIKADCTFFPIPQPVPRFDSLHVLFGDTLTYEIYVQDRAGNKSNHIITAPVILIP